MLRVRVQLGDEYRRFYITRGLATRKNLESKVSCAADLVLAATMNCMTWLFQMSEPGLDTRQEDNSPSLIQTLT